MSFKLLLNTFLSLLSFRKRERRRGSRLSYFCRGEQHQKVSRNAQVCSQDELFWFCSAHVIMRSFKNWTFFVNLDVWCNKKQGLISGKFDQNICSCLKKYLYLSYEFNDYTPTPRHKLFQNIFVKTKNLAEPFIRPDHIRPI